MDIHSLTMKFQTPTKAEYMALGEMIVGGERLVEIRHGQWLTPSRVPDSFAATLAWDWARARVATTRTMMLLLHRRLITKCDDMMFFKDVPQVFPTYRLTLEGVSVAYANKDKWFLSEESQRRIGFEEIPSATSSLGDDIVGDEPDFVNCETCMTPTLMLGTKRCNNCYEVEKRLPEYLKNLRGRIFVGDLLTAEIDKDKV